MVQHLAEDRKDGRGTIYILEPRFYEKLNPDMPFFNTRGQLELNWQQEVTNTLSEKGISLEAQRFGANFADAMRNLMELSLPLDAQGFMKANPLPFMVLLTSILMGKIRGANMNYSIRNGQNA